MNAASGGVARLRGFEPLTHGSGGRCSVRAELQAQEIPPDTSPPPRSPPVPEPHQDLPTRLQGFGAMTDSVFQCRPDLGQRLTIFGDVKNGVVTEPGRPPRPPRDIPFTAPFGKLGRSPRLGHGDHTTKTGGPSVPGVGPKLLEDPLDPIVVGRPLP